MIFFFRAIERTSSKTACHRAFGKGLIHDPQQISTMAG
jgi:hypothetical protein